MKESLRGADIALCEQLLYECHHPVVQQRADLPPQDATSARPKFPRQQQLTFATTGSDRYTFPASKQLLPFPFDVGAAFGLAKAHDGVVDLGFKDLEEAVLAHGLQRLGTAQDGPSWGCRGAQCAGCHVFFRVRWLLYEVVEARGRLRLRSRFSVRLVDRIATKKRDWFAW